MQYLNKHTRRWGRTAALLAIASVLGMSMVGAASCDPQCSTYRDDAQRTGRSGMELTYQPTLAWSMPVNTGFTPVIGQNGTLYYGTYDNYMYARNGDGTVKWAYRTESPACGSAALGADGSVYFGTTGQIVALNANGTSKWAASFRFTSTSQPSPVLLGKDGTIYFGADDNSMYAVNPNGTLKWKCSVGGSIRQALSMSPDGSTLYASCADGRIYAVDTGGVVKWKSNVISPTYNCAVGDDGTIYAGSSTGDFYAFASDGHMLWSFKAQSKITCAAAIASDGTVYFGSQDLNLYALDSSGHLKWTRRTGGPLYSAPTIDNQGNIVLGAWPADIYALNPVDGSTEWTRTVSSVSGASISGPVVLGQEGGLGTIYVLDYNSKTYLTNLTKYTGPVHPEPSSLAALAGFVTGLGLIKSRRRRK